MSSEVSICNLTLSNIGVHTIDSISGLDLPPEAAACKLHYYPARDAVLRDFNWSFAKRIGTLAATTEEVLGWAYAYQYPTDCLKARGIYNPSSKLAADAIPFDTSANAALNNQLVLTDHAEAVLIYTARVTDTNLFDSLFLEAFTLKLGSALAMPLKGDLALKQGLLQEYLKFIESAKTGSANESFVKPTTDNSFLRSR
tara:strand:+ start:22791 stop:23387 length:597 start_codon:yes stop_codon:yes gene_type:complete